MAAPQAPGVIVMVALQKLKQPLLRAVVNRAIGPPGQEGFA
jgi:hypothetical protein